MTGGELKAWRKKQALTQKEAGELLDVSKNYIYMIEAGRIPSRKVSKRFKERSQSVEPQNWQEEVGTARTQLGLAVTRYIEALEDLRKNLGLETPKG